MEFYDLQPTDENIYITYINDVIGRNEELHHFTEIINQIDTNCSIALDGAWGSGKTFFVKQAKMILDAHNNLMQIQNKDAIREKWVQYHKGRPGEFQQFVTIYYDAWLNDNDNDPILSILYSIIKDIDVNLNLKESPKISSAISGIVEFFTNKNLASFFDSLKSKDLLQELKSKEEIHTHIDTFIDEILIERGNRLVIFVDELDRCKPSFAIQLLERIKHYFSNNRITFIFSTNFKELQNTIQQYYGNNFDSSKYLNRFFDLPISIPPVNIDAFCQSIHFSNSPYYVNKICYKIIYQFKLQMRETAKLIKMVHSAFDDSIYNSNASIYSILLFFVPLMFVLKLTDTSAYDQFIKGENATPFLNLFSNEDYRILDYLLSSDETFSTNGNGKYVSKEEKLTQLYESTFNLNFNNKEETIGSLEIDNYVRRTIFDVVSLMSNISNLET